MTLQAGKTKYYTPEEYLALEEKAEFRSEYENGCIVAMSGGTFNHARISSNIARHIGNRASDKCDVLQSDMKVWVESIRRFYYPDVLALYEEPIFYQKRNDTIANPILIVEILSKSTETKDRGEKFFAYQTIESLKEYILVSQDKLLVEQYIKQGDGSWKYLATIGLESIVKLESVAIESALKEIYQRVEIEEENL